MAMSVTEYGLVKNSDGSVCFTIRPDDTPFQGVCSLALEKSTTNLANTDISTWGKVYTSVNNTDLMFFGSPVWKVIASQTESAQVHSIHDTSFTSDTDTTYTFSIYVKSAGISIIELAGIGVNADGWYPIFDIVEGTYIGHGESTEDRWGIEPVGNDWFRVWITHTDSSGGHNIVVYLYDNEGNREWLGDDVSGIYIARPQVEQKSFATSFVDSSRPKGWFYVPLESLGFDPATDDWVIAYWKKPIATIEGSIGDLAGYNIMSIGRYTSDYSVGYIWWGKKKDEDKFKVQAVQSDSSVVASEATLDPLTYFNQWHFEVLLKVGNEIKYYYDGQLKVSLTITDLQTFDQGLYVQGWAIGSDACNSLYANVLYGKAKDSSGNLVWTDSYIQEVYNARAPFAK